ncbi:MAG: hypothetical protein J6Y89_10540 [Lachnospiraceae bacterium]|nr:hypothetical protein [Lachnospiraceae bacterium]
MEKYYYTIYGLTVASDYEFPQFLSIDRPDAPTDIEIVYGGIPDGIMQAIEHGQKAGDRYHEKWFKNIAGIFWIHDDRAINFTEYGRGTVDDAAVYIPGMCFSILLWYRKMIMIHGACLRYNDKTIIIAGDSGAGKSSASTALLDRGALLIADDVTGIGIENGEYYSYPAFPAQKLCVDRMDANGIDKTGLRQIRYDLNKFEIPRPEQFYNEKSKVDAMFRLELKEVNSVDFNPVNGAEKIKVLTDSLSTRWMYYDDFRFEPDDLKRCIGFVRDLPMYRIARNPAADTLNEIVSFIEAKLK